MRSYYGRIAAPAETGELSETGTPTSSRGSNYLNDFIYPCDIGLTDIQNNT